MQAVQPADMFGAVVMKCRVLEKRPWSYSELLSFHWVLSSVSGTTPTLMLVERGGGGHEYGRGDEQREDDHDDDADDYADGW